MEETEGLILPQSINERIYDFNEYLSSMVSIHVYYHSSIYPALYGQGLFITCFYVLLILLLYIIIIDVLFLFVVCLFVRRAISVMLYSHSSTVIFIHLSLICQ